MDWEAFYNNFRQPDFLPGYEIQNRLGGGAFGEVYKAKKHSIGKAFAVKFLKIDDDAQREAVERELEQVRHFAAIDHPNLVTIEDLGTVMGVPYVVMGYAGEDTLARALRQKSLNSESALLYFVQACRGVLALHDRRLVHFDLKPSNIFLKGDIARVGDYGLAKMMTDGRLTLSFGRGTPQYMAPEMLRNRADQRADIYSLGVILYESMASKLPFESDLPGAVPMREKDEPPQFPSDFPALARVAVERCLRIDPKDRYDSISELLTDLGQTARPGDSVRLSLSSGSPGRRVTPVDIPTPIGDKSEARTTAAELTRGAVEVARGMWDGLRTASQPPRPVRAEAAVVSAMPAVMPMPSSPRPSEVVPGEALVIHALSDRPLPAIPSVSRGAESTIPVPPRAAGGWFGTVAATAQLGIEVWFTLLRGLAGRLRGAPRAAQARRGFFAWVGRWLGRGVRLLAFLVLAALLGGLCTLAFYHLSVDSP
ncbi:MAG: serine/threonine-protein kinase [Planctomycetota bacterium]